MSIRPSRLCLLALALLALTSASDHSLRAQAGCGIVCENAKPGAPASEWDISGSGDSSIQGFATEFSVIPGQTQGFKIDTDSSNYTINIYRMGYYGGDGARLVASLAPSATLPQTQPNCLTNGTTGLVDCGNWGLSASWPVPSDAVSGIYFAKLSRIDSGGSSHIFFVVRDDTRQADVLFQTADTTWQAYNTYGGNSLYVGNPAGRAYKVSYNRPFDTRGHSPADFVFNAEYPMVRWLEANGYDVSYFSGADSDRYASEILRHEVFMSVGHDEYWSGAQRANVEAARAAGVHLAFFSGNEVFWKTRWETSIDGLGTPYRTLVSYKETHANAKIDPAGPTMWTGTWRDARFSPPADGGRPENALTGTLFRVNDGNTTSITVPSADGKLRFWRNTSVATLATGAVATLPNGTLGYEWDEAPTNAFTPPGLMRLSTTTRSVNSMLLDNGSSYGAGTVTHSLTLYRHASGALVFGAGTIQWPWGLDANHDRGNLAADVRMKQATVNLLADMDVQAGSLQAGLTQTTASTNLTAPTSTITSPAAGASIPAGTPVTISGTAVDGGGGLLTSVEVSVDGGATWARATGLANWTYSWTASGSGFRTIVSRAYDDSGNAETPGTGVEINVTSGQTCPCTIWAPSAVPAQADDGDPAAVELGTRFRSDINGYITGVRFYKAALNTGTHVGRLWTNTGTLLGSVTFTGETASGWQQANLASAVPVTANTTYLVSYHAPNGHYTGSDQFFATTGLDRPPLHGLRDGVDGANGVYRYGSGGAFPTETYLAEAYWVDVVFSTVPPPDPTPPTVTGFFPPNGSTGVDPAAAVTVTFSEAMDPATLTTGTIGEGGSTLGTIELRDSLNTLIRGALTYDSATRTATLRPDMPLALSTTFTAIVRGGTIDPRVKDLAGNALAANVTWTFTTAAAPPPPPTCPCSIWTPTTVPQKIDDGDPSSVELGTRFRSDVAGYVTGARFYKGALNTGTHIAKLWSNTGTLMGSVTFTGETSSGWQEATFATPLAIAANTTYVISYHANNGHYSSAASYFATSGTDRPPLHALRDGVDGANGLYQYGTSVFPTQTFQSEGYFVDVVFNTSVGPDTTPPTVTAVTPIGGLSGVRTDTTVTATFHEAMNAATITTTTFVLRDPSSTVVPAAVTYNASTRTATLDPSAPLSTLTTYTAVVKGGGADPRVKDVAGNALAVDRTWSFTTAAPPPPPPTEGPGGPVLVITDPANGFTTYPAEILRAEGLNAFATAALSTITAGTLNAYDVVILGEMPLTVGQVSMFTDWVTQGGNLIALRPDKQLAGLMGLTDAGTTLSNAYLQVNTSAAPGAGIVGQTMQFHGTADRYALSGATAVATLYSTASAATTNPAVTMRAVGGNGGHAVAFTYDLARSVVYTRQGNPAWSGQERDGQTPIRSDDLFFGAKTGDVQPDWVDLNKVAIPQADEQQRLLWNILLRINESKRPLPRFWYFPRMFKAVVIMTGDDHANGGTAGRFDQYLSMSAPGCSVNDWDCIRGTSYIFPNTPLSAAQISGYVSQGFELALHVNTGCADYTPATIGGFYTSQLAQFATNYPAVPPPATNRTHCIVWSDYTSQAQAELNHGIRFDTSYYYWPGSWVLNRPGMFTGSGLPMRFATTSGTMIDVYQAATQLTDESGQNYALHADTLFDRALGPEGYYGAFTANMHTDFNPSEGSIGSDAILASAQARGVPVITAKQMLDWLDGRHASSFESIAWTGNVLSFDIAVGAGASGLYAMVPATAAGLTVTGILANGILVPHTVEVIKGVSYAIFAAQGGAYQASYGVPPTPLPSLSIADASVVEGNGGATNAAFVVTLSAASTDEVTAAFATADGSGSSSSDYSATSGTVTFIPGETSRTILVPVNGDLVSEPDESFAVTLTSPVNAVLGRGTAFGIIVNDEPLPSITISDPTVTEGNSGTINASFLVSLSGASGASVTVAFSTASGTATAGTDFVTTSGTLTFAPGTTTQTIPVPVVGDTANETDEQFVVNLSSPTNATIAKAQGAGGILNDDPLPSISIAGVSLTEGNSGTKSANFVLTLSAASGRTVSVAYATANGTATAGSDYVALSGVATFTAGSASTTVTVTLNGDTTFEADETFTVSLSTPTNATIAVAQATGTITNDDGISAIAITDTTVTEGNTGSVNAVLTVSLTPSSTQTVTVAYATSNGTATAGSDYVAASGTVTFSPGVTSQPITIAVTGDTAVESAETINVTLTSPVNAAISDGQGVITITDNDGAPSGGLVAAYGFGEGTGATTADASGLGHTGSIAGASWTTAGKTGNALSFDGVNDLVTIVDTTALDVTRVTMMAWLRPTAITGWRTAVMKEAGGGLAYALYANDNSPARPAAYINTGAEDRRTEGSAGLALNTWTHVAAAYDGATLKIYVNGALVRSRAYTGNIIASSDALRIGGNAIWDEYFAGLIDDVRVYNRALTLAEVQSAMNIPVTP